MLFLEYNHYITSSNISDLFWIVEKRRHFCVSIKKKIQTRPIIFFFYFSQTIFFSFYIKYVRADYWRHLRIGSFLWNVKSSVCRMYYGFTAVRLMNFNHPTLYFIKRFFMVKGGVFNNKVYLSLLSQRIN